MIIDFHVHAFPDEVAPRAIEALFSAYHMPPATDGTVGDLTAKIEAAGIDYALIQPVATSQAQVRSINDWAAGHTHPTILSFGGMHPDYEDVQGEVDRIISLGLKGIKIQGNFQNVCIDSPDMYPIYEAAQGRLIMLFHTGAEVAPIVDEKATPKRLAKIHKDFPNLTIVAAHMGGYLMWDESEEYLVGKNIYLDTSACFPKLISDARLLSMIRNHGTDRILFASDIPLGNPQTELSHIRRIGLNDNELEMVLGGNAKRLLGL